MSVEQEGKTALQVQQKGSGRKKYTCCRLFLKLITLLEGRTGVFTPHSVYARSMVE